MKATAQKGKSGGNEPTPGTAANDLPERWSVQGKTELVLCAVYRLGRSSGAPADAHARASWASSRKATSGS